MFCTNCGAQIPDDSIFCDKCGCRVGGGISEQRNHADSTSFPDERKSGSSKAAKYIVVAVVIAAVVGAGVFFLWKAGVLGSGTAPKPELSVTATEPAPESEKLPKKTTTPARTDSATEEPTEEAQDSETHVDAEQTAETGTESKAETSGESVEGPVEEPAPL
ncbi:MAG: zinc-ribbon domain-containing protein, partial [Oscillospiraceae bacterium]|nr:zinc-ribbon domain-containing protein [Oscillospiraceae bacterium]